MTLEKSKEHIAKFADSWVKAHQKLSLNWIQCTERILFHIEQLPDGYLILKRVDLVLKMRPVRVEQFRPPLKMMLPLSNLLFSKIHDIWWKRCDLSGLSLSYVYTILKEKLKLQKICACWMPHLLTPEQKKDRVEKASVLLSRFKNRDSRRLREVVTGDQTWLYFSEPDNKLNNKMWVGENNECPVVARRSRSVGRVMYALFFDSDGIVARVSVPENCSVTGTFYHVRSAVVNHYQVKRPRAGSEGSNYSMIMHPLTVLQW